MYPPELVKPMREDLTKVGFTELFNAEDVNSALSKEGTTLIVVNSVCGCAAGMARPGIAMALTNAEQKPDNLYTVFAGNDAEATAAARVYFHGYPPTSPCIGLLKNGKLAAIIQRYDIEGYTAQEVADKLTAEFDKHC